MTTQATPSLARYLALAYILLVIYASLHPLSGWAEPGAPLLAYLSAPWPRYVTVFDLLVNVLAYVPLGFLLVPAFHPRFSPAQAACIAMLVGGAVSFSMETLQNFLPSRVPSNVDLGTNVVGCLAGALLGTRWGALLTDGGRLHALRLRLFLPGKRADFGLVLLGCWLLSQLNPEILLFGSGDLRSLLGFVPTMPYTVRRFFAVEFGVAAAGCLAVGLTAATLLRGRRLWPAAALLFAALALKAFASAALVSPGQFGYWITRGNMAGFVGGSLLMLGAARLPATVQRALAAIALMFATALVNLAPENPYITASVSIWQQGQFFNFNGLTRVVASLWPFAAMSYLMLRGRRA